MKKIALGMSGGVDSSVCAHLLVQQGYQVTGVFLECWRAPGCRSEEDRQDALQVALDLGIPFQVLDFKKVYKDKVVENFFSEYKAGRTPNPDVLCNKEIKFGLFYDWAMANGFDAVATGHYAKIVDFNGTFQLAIPVDRDKDQTYFLYLLKENQLKRTLFPLADFSKEWVRTEAKKRSLHVASKKDSVGICFIGDIDVHQFLKDRLGENPGEVVDVDGNVVGSHKGLWFYTIGQRHGFTVNKKVLVKLDNGQTFAKDNIPPFYVIAKKPKQNQLVVGFGKEAYSNRFQVENLHWINKEPQQNDLSQLLVRIRHTGELIPCQLEIKSESKAEVHLSQSTKGIAQGQSAVFYQQKQNKICLGGGVMVF